MNLLRSLVQRSLGTAPALDPPKVPFVNVVPDPLAPDAEAPLAPPTPPTSMEPQQPERSTPPLQPPAALSELRRDAPARTPNTTVTARPEQEARPQTVTPRPALPPNTLPADNPVSVRSPESTAPSAPTTAPVPLPAEIKERTVVRPAVIERHTHVERVIEGPVESAPEARQEKQTEVPPPVAQVAPPMPAPQPQSIVAQPVLRPPPQPPAPLPSDASKAAPASPPSVSVSIGSIKVAVAAPKAGARAKPFRPAAPPMDLAAYNARRVKP